MVTLAQVSRSEGDLMCENIEWEDLEFTIFPKAFMHGFKFGHMVTMDSILAISTFGPLNFQGHSEVFCTCVHNISKCIAPMAFKF